MNIFRSVILLAIVVGMLATPWLPAQTQLVSSEYWPAELEFPELKAVLEEKDLKDPAILASLPNGPALTESGLGRYAQRLYALADSGTLSIEVLTMADVRGAYSLLTFFAASVIQEGPPFDFYSSSPGILVGAAGRYFVRLRAEGAQNLLPRVATSVSNRIGPRGSTAPEIILHFPEDSCVPDTIRYFLGSRAIADFGTPVGGRPLKIPDAVEAAQAACRVQDYAGTLTLLNFPTITLAEDYFASDAFFAGETTPDRQIYSRQTGALVEILEGNFPPATADKTLGSVRFTYSVRWIYDRNNRQNQIVWGVPTRILGTVVRSLLFTALLCLLSVAVGVLIAGGRIFARRRWGLSDASELIRLKINED